MQDSLKWIPVAGCVVAAVYLLLALTASHELIKAAHASVAIAFAVVPYMLVKVVRDALAG